MMLAEFTSWERVLRREAVRGREDGHARQDKLEVQSSVQRWRTKDVPAPLHDTGASNLVSE